MTVTVVPWLGGCPHRERNWRWIRPQLQHPVREAPGSLPWIKALAVMPTVERTDDEIVIVHDADVYVPPWAINGAVWHVREEGAQWAVPHTLVRRLTDQGTEQLIRGEEPEEEERPYAGLEGGGIVVLRRDVLLQTPLDPRFVSWGGEDESWGVALRTLHGPPWRGNATLTHLWHPPQQRMNRRRGSVESWNLRRRYFDARRSPVLMRTLLKEARVALSDAKPGLHDHEAARVG